MLSNQPEQIIAKRCSVEWRDLLFNVRIGRSLAHLCDFAKARTKCSMRPDFPATADLIVPAFTRNVKLRQPPAKGSFSHWSIASEEKQLI